MAFTQSNLRKSSFLFLVATVLLFACSQSPDKQKAKTPDQVSGGTIATPLSNKPATLDPAGAHSVFSTSIIRQIYSGLIRYDVQAAPEPCVAKSWEVSHDGTEYVFNIDPAARFHDGSPVTAADAAYTMQRALRFTPNVDSLAHILKIKGAGPYRNNQTESVSGIDVLDSHTLRVTLEEPYAPFLTALGLPDMLIVPKHLIEKGHDLSKHPIGCGPFAFKDSTDDIISLQPHAAYHLKKPFIDQLEFRIYSGGNIKQALSDFRSGQLDLLPAPGFIRKKLHDIPNLQWVSKPSASTVYMGFNIQNKKLSKDIRKTLQQAIHQDTQFESILGKGQTRAAYLTPPGIMGFRQAPELEKNEHPTLQPLTIQICYNSNSLQPILEHIAEQWKSIGVNATLVQTKNWTEFKSRLKTGDFEAFCMAWHADMPDPDNIFQPVVASDGASNYSKFESDRADELLVRARQTIDPVKRMKMYWEVESLVHQEAPLIPLFYLSTQRVLQPYLHGLTIPPLGTLYIRFEDAWLDRTAPSMATSQGVSPNSTS